ncbi:MAG TPA: secretin N-terminal domain-containing protein [Burkholderiales bacterium]|nr:secretin N-terminal domain-containing protein [Burkholderiales bacterium]
MALTLVCTLSACAIPDRPATLDRSIVDEMNTAAAAKPKPARESAVEQALIPPLRIELPKVDQRALEPRFDLSVNNAPAKQVLLAIVSGTRYSMLVHPDISGTISVDLKDVTVREALDSLRDLYGYEYRVEGARINVQAPSLQTRMFKVNYLTGQRQGRSEVRVISGSVADAGNSQNGNTGVGNRYNNNNNNQQQFARATDAAHIMTSTSNDFWKDLAQTLSLILGTDAGRSVVVNPQAGVIVVRGMPADMRNVADYLKAIKLSVERQVMLEAKIVEVTLADAFQTGVNWAALGSNLAFGVLNPNTVLGATGPISSLSPGAPAPPLTSTPGSAISTGNASNTFLPGLPGGSIFGLAFQSNSFAALLNFLEGQGSVQVLSSPRIAALNNQKAVLKVGTDEFFVTNVESGSAGTSVGSINGGTNTFPTLTLQPFFSGVALDVTPQIDEDSNVILHIHPSVSNVSQDNRELNLGELFGSITLPLARSTVSETDSIVKVADGNIVAIGGLMKVDIADRQSGLPGVQDVPGLSMLFGTRNRQTVKKELVILIRPTIISGETNTADIGASRDRFLDLGKSRSSTNSGDDAVQ